MPVAEKNTQPKGRPYGEGVREAEFVRETQPALTQAAQPASAGVGVDTFQRDLLDTVTGVTDRPEEPVTLGLDAFLNEETEAVKEWFPVLQDLAADPAAPQIVKEMAARAALHLGL